MGPTAGERHPGPLPGPEGPAGRTRGRGRARSCSSRTYFRSIDFLPSECTSHALERLPGHRTGRERGVSWLCPGWGVVRDRRAPRSHAWPCPAPTVLTGPLLRAQRADLHFLRGAQRPPWGHQTHSCCAEEAVGSAQGWRAEPARPGQGQCTPNGQGLHGALWWRKEARRHSAPQDLGPVRAPLIHGAGEQEGKVHASTYSKGACLVRSSLPAWSGIWSCVTPLPL